MKKVIKMICIALMFVMIPVFFLSSCSGGDAEGESKGKKEYTLGDTFKFDGLEITMGTTVSFTTIDNEFSDNYNRDVVRVRATTKNLKSTSHSLNMFYYTYFSPSGVECDSADAYFDDDFTWNGGDLLPGASYTRAFYMVYDTDGDYKIIFDNFSKKITVKIPVSKEA